MMFGGKLQLNVSEESNQNLSEAREMVLNFLVPLLLLLISLGVLFFYDMPTHKLIPGLLEKLAQKTTDVAVLQDKVNQLKTLEASKALVIDDLVKMSWALEERDKVPELTQQVRLMSRDSGVVFSSLDYANSNRDSNYVLQLVPSQEALELDPNLYKNEKVTVTVTSANYTGLINFLKISETSIRLFSVESLRISAREGANEVDLVMASPYLNTAFSAYSETSALPIDLNNTTYRQFMQRLDTFTNYARTIDATLPKI